jgi:uncharacterized protein
LWKNNELKKYAKTFQHPAWGWNHFQRVLKLSLHLAEKQNFTVDEDSLTAASWLHDIGVFSQFRVKGMDHTDRSIQLVEDVLTKYNFPPEKIPAVKDIILGHMYYREPSARIEAIIFHDADVLDFMGYIGIARLLAIVGVSDWTPDVASALKLIEQFSRELLEKLHTPLARKLGESRKQEMVTFLNGLSKESDDWTSV